jgi:hypothetical protein
MYGYFMGIMGGAEAWARGMSSLTHVVCHTPEWHELVPSAAATWHSTTFVPAHTTVT